jgi:tetraacyldisaccharide 4'-kinase
MERASLRAPDFWYSDAPGPAQRFLAAVMAPLGTLYGLAGALKQQLARPFDPCVPVICIGNLNVGGTGKTPIAIALAHVVGARRPFLLTRGYGGRLIGPVLVDKAVHGAKEVGDEALLLAAAAPTIVARNRRLGAGMALAGGAGLIIMDDGFQNFALKKTLSILIIDGQHGFGNGQTVPAGPLRERAARGLKRADALIVMGETSLKTEAAIAGFLGPRFKARLMADEGPLPHGPLLAFAGIGRPEKFFATLTELGRAPVAVRAFPDHHMYRPGEIEALRMQAAHLNASLITTEKDLARLAAAQAEGIAALAVTAVVEDKANFARLLSQPAPAPG